MGPRRWAVLGLVCCICSLRTEASGGETELKAFQGELRAGAGYTGRRLNQQNSPVAKLRAILKEREMKSEKPTTKSNTASCKNQKIDPYIPLTVSQADFIFMLIKIKVPSSCGAFELSSFQQCSKDFGVTKGCCTAKCTDFLQTIDGECWEDFQTEFCKEEDNQIGSTIDLLMRRCDTDKREIQCLQSTPCDERVLKPKAAITMKTAAFAFSLGKVKTPSSCKNFELSDLLECSSMIGLDGGCCDKKCSDIFAKIGDACWKGVEKALCADNSDQPSILVDLLSQLCDKTAREISCEEAAYSSRSTVVGDKPLNDLDEQLLIAAQEGNLSKVQALLVTGADVNAKDKSKNSPMDWAAFEGHAEVIEALLQAGGNMDSRDSDGRTAIMEAAWGGHTEAMKTLIEGGSYIDLESEDGSTALIYAAGEGHVEAVELLINEGSDMDAENDSGATALMVAAHNGHTEVVEALIDAGADTEIQDKKWGQTAVMWAAERGYIGAVGALLAGGSPKGTNSKDGSTAESLAAENGHADIVALLKTPCKAERSSTGFLCSGEGG